MTSRAAVGGLLVAAAVVGLLVAQREASRRPTTPVVVAARALPAGHVLTGGDLVVRRLELDAGLASHTFASPKPLLGRPLAASLGQGDLVQPSSLSPRAPDPNVREVSFAADPARALGQRVVPGDVIDVYATDGDGASARTALVVRGARVLDRQARGSAGGFIYTVGLVDPKDVQALVAASGSGSLAVVRAGPAAASGAP